MSSYISLENKSDIEVVSSVFISLLANQAELTSIPINTKEKLISSLLIDLDENGVQQKWNNNVRLLALQTLKILGRDANGCDLLFSDEGFKILLTHAKLQQSSETKSDTPVTQESLTCIANMLLLKECTRDLLYKYKGISSVCQLLKDNGISIKTQFLLSRILFLMTIKPQPVVQSLIDNLGIIDILHNSLNKLVDQLNSSLKEDTNSLPITRVMVLNEQLKLLFNLMMNDPEVERDNLVQGERKSVEVSNKDNVNKFENLLLPTLKILLKVPISTQLPLSPPHSHAIHALLNFPIEPYKSIWFPPSLSSKKEQYIICYNLIDTLKSIIYMVDPDKENVATGVVSKNDPDFDEIITPLVVLLRKIAEEDNNAKILIREELLPDNIDRSKPLEKGNSLSARLIRLMTSVMLPHLKNNVSELLFALCDQDANLFVHHVGYGNAAGFLLSKNIMISPSSSNTTYSDRPINPITGQYYDTELPSLSNMTDEEKEREAEKLFVLFERLKKTGVMDVVNPVEEAIKSGKIQEYKEKEDEKDD
ncbi:guanine nucleotide exchange factor [Glomus cerebriforme]|uniref:Guanine nucleotide exchange factor n=1 Tax=Glomus cerebriforme TaxID=658196 RepID=A0A397TP05_9GLOM|nr:guanine nucleotide exchange factor [Glomus cerebriforme]